jgi:hypothetical protein
VTGTATSEPALLAAALLAAALLCAGCGSGGGGRSRSAAAATPPAGFAAIDARPAPAGWRAARIPTGAVLRYPPSWRPAGGDAGTATVVLREDGKRIAGYLNVTPRQSDETLADWPGFRVGHNAREGDRSVTAEAVARRVPFRGGRGTCVRDRYRTVTGASYIEIACLVTGRGGARAVIVGAAPPEAWARISPTLYRSLSAFTA